MGEDFDTLLDDLLGAEPQQRFEAAAAQEAAGLAEIDNAPFSLAPAPEVLAEIEAEKAEIEARAKADGTWMKAPNGQPSKLNKDQWVAVRTKRFKEWFGDWESASHNSFLDGQPIATMQGNEVPVFPKLNQLAKWVADYWKNQHGGSVTRADLGAIALDQAAASSSIGHGMGAIKGQAFHLVPDVLKKGRLLGKLPHTPNKPDAYLIAAPADIGGNTFIILVEVRRDANSQRLYVHEAVKRKLQTGFNSAAATSSVEDAKPRSPAGAIRSFMEKLRSVNPDSVSKVVDENGEPMVVYHGTNADFTEFKGYAYFFTANPDTASRFAELRSSGRGGENVMPVFLALKDPVRESMDGRGWKDMEDRLESAFSKGDSAIFDSVNDAMGEETQLIAFSPAQIKSATANAGTFSAETGDIRFSLASVADTILASKMKKPEFREALYAEARRRMDKLRTDGEWRVSKTGVASRRTGTDTMAATTSVRGRKKMLAVIRLVNETGATLPTSDFLAEAPGATSETLSDTLREEAQSGGESQPAFSLAPRP